MYFGYDITFSLIEWLTLTGLAQCLFILVYIVSRMTDWKQASIAIGYFFFLALAFGLQFALRLEDFADKIRVALWFAAAMGPPLCYLLVLQVVKLTELPSARHFIILLVAPLGLGLVLALSKAQGFCEAGEGLFCTRFFEALYWLASMTGALCMLALFVQSGLFAKLWNVKGARERYWLIMTFIAANVLHVLVNFLLSTGRIRLAEADALQASLGIAFAYLAMTTLFRVYPLPVHLNAVSRMRTLSAEDKKIVDQVKKLMELDKVYHEHNFSRADLAREVGTSENTLSRAINSAFGKSFPRLLNEFRVEDAKRMLHDPSIPIQVLAFEVGFNSLASFNRVFREVTGQTPSHYRSSYLEALKEDER